MQFSPPTASTFSSPNLNLHAHSAKTPVPPPPATPHHGNYCSTVCFYKSDASRHLLISRIIQYLLRCDRLISLIVSLRRIHAAACVRIPFLFRAEEQSVLCADHPHYLLICDGHRAVAAVWLLWTLPLWTPARPSLLWAAYLEVGPLDHRAVLVPVSEEQAPQCLPLFMSHRQGTGRPFSASLPVLASFWILFSFLITTALMGMKRYLAVIGMCISLVVSDIQCFFMC